MAFATKMLSPFRKCTCSLTRCLTEAEAAAEALLTFFLPFYLKWTKNGLLQITTIRTPIIALLTT